MSDLYRCVVGGDEFDRYEQHWVSHGTLPDGVATVLADDDGDPVEFYVPATIDYEAAISHLEWLRGPGLTAGQMAEVFGAGFTGEGGSDGE